jgi:flagellar hook-associated protein 3 FlgL
MLNIHRNSNSLNKYYNQLSTGKKIQMPSDDPILASRALKFRTNVAETEQYMKNVAQGTSWMETTEAAYNNVLKILASIRDLAEHAASDTCTYEDRQKYISDIASLNEQVGMEMNVTYGGRYVFSGYRTDQPPVIAENNDTLYYTGITQYFTERDVQYTMGYWRDLTAVGGSEVEGAQGTTLAAPLTFQIGDLIRAGTVVGAAVTINGTAYNPGNKIETNVTVAGAPVTLPAGSTLPPRDIAVVKLAYKNLTAADLAASSLTRVSLNDTANPYSTVGNYIVETGEVIVAVDPITGLADFAGTSVGGSPIFTEEFKSPGVSYDPPVFSLAYDKQGFKKGELNPQIYFPCTDRTPGSQTLNKNFNANILTDSDHQHFEFEFSVNTRVRVNSNAYDVFTDKMYGDMQAILGKITYMNEFNKEDIRTRFTQLGLTGEELEDAVAQETQKIQKVAQERFGDLMSMCDKHFSKITEEHTDLGSRMKRMELIQTRLQDDRVNYTKLMSDNEDVDFADAMMHLSSLEAIYEASLKTGSNIIQLTLANYI